MLINCWDPKMPGKTACSNGVHNWDLVHKPRFTISLRSVHRHVRNSRCLCNESLQISVNSSTEVWAKIAGGVKTAVFPLCWQEKSIWCLCLASVNALKNVSVGEHHSFFCITELTPPQLFWLLLSSPIRRPHQFCMMRQWPLIQQVPSG